MQAKSNAAVFIGMTYPWGVIRHFALLGVELCKNSTENIDIYYASIYRDADRGAWGIVNSALPESRIIRSVTFAEVLDRISSLCLKYEKVLIHCGGGWGQMIELIKLRRRVGKGVWRKIRIVVTTHSFNNGTWKRIPTCFVQFFLYLFFADLVIFPCEWIKKRFTAATLLNFLGKTSVVPLGCEGFSIETIKRDVPTSIQATSMKDLFRKEADIFKLIYLAAFRKGKMHEWLVSAIAPVLLRNKKVYLLLCGVGDREIIQSVKNTVERLGLKDQIILPGQIPREDVPWLLSHCDCAIVPSRSETFGHCFLEPMFAGIPVLGTQVGVGKDVILDNQTGHSFSLSKNSSLVDAVEWMIKNRHILKQMGASAKKLVEEKYTHTTVASQLIRLYAKVLGVEERPKVNIEGEPYKPNIELIRHLMGLSRDECYEFRHKLNNKNSDNSIKDTIDFLLSCRERSAPIEGEKVFVLDSLLRGDI